ncbi:MAG: penicillin-insensitive murein endopeptidase [candidate division Zixibacteria bacterium]|nr:penicillin-insensitive murein endopeptidase [candidate division Zixibacteria bacterium]
MSRTKIKFAVLITLSIFTLGFDICHWPEKPPTETPPDVCSDWDTDCDNISNAVETNSANSYLGLDPNSLDTNFSIAHGEPNNGWIEKAFNLPDQGTGYYHYYGTDMTDEDDWGVLTMINMVEGAGRAWYDDHYTPPRIGVGDISWGNAFTQQFGGPWPPDHISHQDGLDVDIRYVRNDGSDTTLNLYTQPTLYDKNATFQLMKFLANNGKVTKIIVSQYARIVDGGIVIVDSTAEHDNHFHIRIEDPDGTGN